MKAVNSFRMAGAQHEDLGLSTVLGAKVAEGYLSLTRARKGAYLSRGPSCYFPTTSP